MEELNRISRTVLRLEQENRQIVKIFSGNPVNEGFIYPREIIQNGLSGFLDTQAYSPESKGLLEAREAIVRFYKNRNVDYSPDDIQITSGTSESYHYLFSILTQPGDNVLMPCPVYPLLEHIGSMSGIELRHYHLREDKGWTIDTDELEKLCNARTRAIVLISPHNPTGNFLTIKELETVGKLARERNIALICDEVFSEFLFNGQEYPSAARWAKDAPLVLTMDGLSKMCALPWLKLGWTAVSGSDRELVQETSAKLEMTADMFLSSNTFAQHALSKILEQGKEFMKSYRTAVEEQKTLALEILSQSKWLSFSAPEAGFYVTAKVLSDRLDEEELVVRLLEDYGLYVYPGYFFDIEDEPHLIISFLPKKEELEKNLRQLTLGLDRILSEVETA